MPAERKLQRYAEATLDQLPRPAHLQLNLSGGYPPKNLDKAVGLGKHPEQKQSLGVKVRGAGLF
jgi:hypothetical protein